MYAIIDFIEEGWGPLLALALLAGVIGAFSWAVFVGGRR